MKDSAKKFIGTIYLLNKKAVKGFSSEEVVSDDPVSYAKKLSDANVDEIYVFDLCDGSDKAHDEAIDMIKDICKAVDVPVMGAGNVRRMEDVKKLLYAGCSKAEVRYSEDKIPLFKEVSEKFGRDKITAGFDKEKPDESGLEQAMEYAAVAVLLPGFKASDFHCEKFAVTEVMDETAGFDGLDKFFIENPEIDGAAGAVVNDSLASIDDCKKKLLESGLKICALEPKFSWADLKKNSDGMVPVIVQDYRTDQVLMLAYMNEEAYNNTLRTGKMTYFSRSRNQLWLKGETSSHYQYVKSLTADCDLDTILAKVHQIGAACHTGSYSCFYNEIAKKDYSEKNPQKVLDSVYEVIKDRRENPREGSYTNYLFDKGLDKILKKVGEEATEMVIAAKNPGGNEVIYEMSDFLYHMMVLMAVKNVSWEDITDELSRR